MVASQQSPLDLALALNRGKCKSLNGSPWSKVFRVQANRRQQRRKISIQRRVLLKRRAVGEGSIRPINGIEKRIRTLQRLVPNGKSIGLNGLFRETAEYIMCLQMRVKVMQIMIRLLSKSDE